MKGLKNHGKIIMGKIICRMVVELLVNGWRVIVLEDKSVVNCNAY
jgi:hypothetical protein